MEVIESTEKHFRFDEDGYLVNFSDWSKDLAESIAASEGLTLTEAHWEVINFLRDYYKEFKVAPMIRILTKAIGQKLGEEKANSKYLYKLYPEGPAKQACKIAGLPYPTGCV
ncbi:MAG: TusE/DsrC/DsvC family sulfur relay protein [Nitrospinae bacterium]|nr:TusE/DsrC/DsvC family sulfur relay protein [Nitrospinota bacterium]